MSRAVAYSWSISGLEFGTWGKAQGPSINPVAPTAFQCELVPSGLRVSVEGPAYAGALVNNAAELPYQSQHISFKFKFKFDEAVVYGQVSETDMKLTDANGWTYDGSFQLDRSRGWMAQVNNPWVDTGFKVPVVQDQWNQMQIDYLLDYAAHTITIVAVNGTAITQPPIPAKQVGWDKRKIVTQLQLCTSGQEGEYAITYSAIGYTGQ
jgi:hypothetical protein